VKPTPGSQLALFTTYDFHAFITDRVLAACLYGHEPAGGGRAEWGRRQQVARRGMI
jgi:hypothetical protein